MQTSTTPPVALTIAGSDSGGGAGLQADLKTFAALGVHGTSAITAVTSQNTVAVSDYQVLPASLVTSQISDVVGDLGCAAAKTGMLGNADVVRAVAAAVRALNLTPLVVDPVMIASSGGALLQNDAVEILAAELLPLAAVVTPNFPEAERLSGRPVREPGDALAAARAILRLGPRAVIVKGGHAAGGDGPGGTVTDVLVLADVDQPLVLSGPRLPSPNTHGTGCVFSAALTAELAKGRPLDVAFRRARLFVTEAIRYGLALGHGRGPVNVPAAAAMVAGD